MIVVACDHAGFKLKQKLIKWFDNKHFNFFDVGATKFDIEDSFVKYAKEGIEYYNQNGKGDDFLLLICGSGIGMDIVANRNSSIRAVLCYTPKQAMQARLHNNANCICVGARNTSKFIAKKIIKTFMNSKFLEGKYKSRMESI